MSFTYLKGVVQVDYSPEKLDASFLRIQRDSITFEVCHPFGGLGCRVNTIYGCRVWPWGRAHAEVPRRGHAAPTLFGLSTTMTSSKGHVFVDSWSAGLVRVGTEVAVALRP
jgi:hypothetical protein